MNNSLLIFISLIHCELDFQFIPTIYNLINSMLLHLSIIDSVINLLHLLLFLYDFKMKTSFDKISNINYFAKSILISLEND